MNGFIKGLVNKMFKNFSKEHEEANKNKTNYENELNVAILSKNKYDKRQKMLEIHSILIQFLNKKEEFIIQEKEKTFTSDLKTTKINIVENNNKFVDNIIISEKIIKSSYDLRQMNVFLYNDQYNRNQKILELHRILVEILLKKENMIKREKENEFTLNSHLLHIEKVKRKNQLIITNFKKVNYKVKKTTKCEEILKKIEIKEKEDNFMVFNETEMKRLADELELYFSEYYEEYREALYFNRIKLKFANYNEKDLLEVLNSNNRFYRLVGRIFCLTKWILDEVEKRLEETDVIYFSEIKYIVKKLFKKDLIGVNRLSKIFSDESRCYDIFAIKKIKESLFPLTQLYLQVDQKQGEQQVTPSVEIDLVNEDYKDHSKLCLLEDSNLGETFEGKKNKGNHNIYSNSNNDKVICANDLEFFFDLYYKKYNSAIKLSSLILNFNTISEYEIVKIIKYDKRFYMLSIKKFCLLKWILDGIEIKLRARSKLSFSEVKFVTQSVLKTSMVNVNGLRTIFYQGKAFYDIEYISKIRKDYLPNIEGLKIIIRKDTYQNNEIFETRLKNEDGRENKYIISCDKNSINEINKVNLSISHQDKEILELEDVRNYRIGASVKTVRGLKEFGFKNGYVYSDDIDEVDISEDYESITELLMDFSNLGIEFIDR
ncbi:MAG TPA: hypothetical protein VIK86_04275 [Candidatus Paceibacterota bacterium]